jgi:acylphosphatase
MLELTIFIHGQVQDLAVRGQILDLIDQFSWPIKGEAKLLATGTLKIVAQAELDELREFRSHLFESLSQYKIRDIEDHLREIDQYTFDTFNICYDEN